jgi:malonyl CoA-acyl carrier protein transacylase
MSTSSPAHGAPSQRSGIRAQSRPRSAHLGHSLGVQGALSIEISRGSAESSRTALLAWIVILMSILRRLPPTMARGVRAWRPR